MIVIQYFRILKSSWNGPFGDDVIVVNDDNGNPIDSGQAFTSPCKGLLNVGCGRGAQGHFAPSVLCGSSDWCIKLR